MTDHTDIIAFCPHCECCVLIPVKQTNCRIFRHGAIKATGAQINPHLPKAECDRLFSENLIIGCGKPFQLDVSNVAVPCDYI